MPFLRVAQPADEWLRDFRPTQEAVNASNADIFTFWQRFPDVTPHYDYQMEWDNVAVLYVNGFDEWRRRVGKKTRNMVRKAERSGVCVRTVRPDDEFFRGWYNIYNEKPIRQGRPFPQYGKTFAEFIAQRESRSELDEGKNTFIGAYYNGELIGFLRLLHTDRYTLVASLLCFDKHRDKAPMNALISKAVQVCAEKHVRYLNYERMVPWSLGDFKRHNGFIKCLVPRYYIPRTFKGRFALAMNLHHGWTNLLPVRGQLALRTLRAWFYERSSFLFRFRARRRRASFLYRPQPSTVYS